MRKRPGKNLQMCLRKMSEYLSHRGGDANKQAQEPIVKNYLTSVLLPSWGKGVSPRNEAELRFLAEAMDALLTGNLGLVGDLMAQQFKAVEAAQGDQGWQLAKHLQATPSGKVSALPEQDRIHLMRTEEKELKRRALETKLSKKTL